MECELQPLFDVEETGVHSYLLTLNDTLLLVDCGLAPSYEACLRTYDDHIEKVSAILLTSAAMEHAGACLYILSRKDLKIFIPTNLVPSLHATVLHTFLNLCMDMQGNQPMMDYLLLDHVRIERLFNSALIQSPEEANVISITQSILGSYHRINADEYFWCLQLAPSTNKVICMPTCRHKSSDMLQNCAGYQSLERAIALDLPLSSKHLRGEVCFVTPLNPPKSIMNMPMLDAHTIMKLLDRAFTPISENGAQSARQYGKILFSCDGITGLTNVLILLTTALKKYTGRPGFAKDEEQDGVKKLIYKICLLIDEQVLSYYKAYLHTLSIDNIITPEFFITSRAQQLDVDLPFPLFILTPDTYFHSGSARQLFFSTRFAVNTANMIVLTSIRPYLSKAARRSPGYKLLSLIILQSQGKPIKTLSKITTPQLSIVDKETYHKQISDQTVDVKPQKARQPEAPDSASLSPEARERYIATNISLVPGVVAFNYFDAMTRTINPVIDLELSMTFLRRILGLDKTHTFTPPADAYKDVTMETPTHIHFDIPFVAAIVHYLATGYDVNGYRAKNTGRTPVVKLGGVEIQAPCQIDFRAHALSKYGIQIPSSLVFGVENSNTEYESTVIPYLSLLAEANVVAAQAAATTPKNTSIGTGPSPNVEKLKNAGEHGIVFQQRLREFFRFVVASLLKDVDLTYSPATDELHLTYRAGGETDEDQGFEDRSGDTGALLLQNYGYLCNRTSETSIRDAPPETPKAYKTHVKAVGPSSDMSLTTQSFFAGGMNLPFLNTKLSPLNNICMVRHRQIQEFSASLKVIIAETKESAHINVLSDVRSTEMHCDETIKIEKSEKVYKLVASPTLTDSFNCLCDLVFLLDEPMMQLQDTVDLLRGRFKKYIVTTSKKLHQNQIASALMPDIGNSYLFTTGETITFSLQDQVPKAYFPMYKALAFKKIDKRMSIAHGYFSTKVEDGIALEVETIHPYDSSAELVLLNCYDSSDERKQALRKSLKNTLSSIEQNNKFLLKHSTIELNETGQMTITGNVSVEMLSVLNCVQDSNIYLPL